MLLPDNEGRRLELLYQYQILDTVAEEFFDEITQLAADLCEMPIALISLVDAEREWFKSKVGVNQSQVLRSFSFGAYTILESERLIIPDTLQDERFTKNPLVASEPYCRCYLGVPLIASNSFAIGSLCVIDIAPRHFSIKQQAILQKLARQVVRYLNLHREKIINEHQKMINLLFRNHPNPMWVYDGNTLEFLDVNEAAVIHYGYSRKELLGMRVTDIDFSEDVPLLKQCLVQKNSKFSFAGEGKHRLQDGQMIDVEIVKHAIEYNGKYACLVYNRDVTERKKTEQAVKTQLEREHLMRTVSLRIRHSLNLQDILNATVQEVRDLLQVDRVIFFRFASDMSGKIVAESVDNGWTASIDIEIEDTCFKTGAGLEYYQGCKKAIANIYEAGLTECHIRMLEQFEVKASLVVPILLQLNDEDPSSILWGLLVAHQCSHPRQWEEHQMDLLDQLTVPIAIAIQQSSILQQAQTEIAQRQQAEVKLRSALAEKEVLLKEIHHRVKNNLQIVSSLLQLQSQTLDSPEAIKVLRESQNRIESISLIHKNLYTAPNIGQLDVAEYIENLATNLLISYQVEPARIGLKTYIDTIILNIDQAIACGLIINELISNALKYAFPEKQIGNIIISLGNFGDSINMTIQDDGIGLPNSFNLSNTNSLGLSLVYDLVTAQLDGSINVENNQGTVFKIQFPQLTLQQ
ncbi:MAG: histidine kinase dimerization/phosphoacceptor domain -containing protein [Aulosira sp. DedQUE10]|nr:histidine kinase dimerization/phosphoacceptor domain -containing protein [Aulosira sp. DedQUE10]